MASQYIGIGLQTSEQIENCEKKLIGTTFHDVLDLGIDSVGVGHTYCAVEIAKPQF